jgi:DNA-binding MurR/RpiR family transcriptional regulator
VAGDEQARPDAAVARWLDLRLNGRSISPRQQQVLGVLRAQPRLVSYSSVTDVAVAAHSNASTVTRTAQSLGYHGWADFQVEFRSRYLASLSAIEVAAEHGAAAHDPCQRALTTDQQHLAHLARTVSTGTVLRIAEAIATARRTLVIAGGSYAVPGRALAHNVGIAGYEIRLLEDNAALSNAIAKIGPEDVAVVFSLWRVYDSTVRAVEIAAEAGAFVAVITDDDSSAVAEHADALVRVPSEGAGFFPSLVPSLAVAQAIVVEVAAVDTGHSLNSIRAAEQAWDRMQIMRPR